MAEYPIALSLKEKVRIFAEEKHSGAFRKNKACEPFIVHPKEVADLVRDSGGNEVEIAAAWLHDIVEDTPTTLAEIEKSFGLKMREIVEGLTDPPEFKELPLLVRKARQALRIRLKSRSVKLVKLADQIANVRSLVDPPIAWSEQKCRDYVEGAVLVAIECKGIDDFLDSQFESACLEIKQMKKEKRTALIVVDVQNDFCPGGALAVPKGDEVVSVINQLLAERKFDYTLATQDWHPENHCSFIENGGQWPKHCVQFTTGAKLRHDLEVRQSLTPTFIVKGVNPNKEAYSGFDGTPLEETLRRLNVKNVYVCGLATDYCVKATALDAKKAGFKTFVIIDACRGVDVRKGDVDRAVEEMRKVGIKIITLVET